MANIKTIIHTDNRNEHSKVTIELTNSEIGIIANALYYYYENYREVNEIGRELKNIITICREISTYGHMDEWAISTLVRKDEEKKNDKSIR